MARHIWPTDTVFTRLELQIQEPVCPCCSRSMTVCDHRHRKFFTLQGPLHLVCKLVHCPDQACPQHHRTVSPWEELSLAPPRSLIGWDVFAWIGQRRFARHWSVPNLRSELLDRFAISLSADTIEDTLQRYQTMVAARQADPARLAQEYAGTEAVLLAIDGLQPEKGHETLYVVRELHRKRVWFAQSLLSSSAAEVQRLFEQARDWAQRLGKPVLGWVSDKQDAFLTSSAAVFPGVPHRLCHNHFLRGLAKPVLEKDSQAKVKMRSKVRGLRDLERQVLAKRDKVATDEAATTGSSLVVAEAAASCPADPTRDASLSTLASLTEAAVEPLAAVSPAGNDSNAAAAVAATAVASPEGDDVVLDYCTVVRGILNDDQGGPLQPPGLRMAEALQEVHQSLQRNLEAKKGGARRSS